MDTPITEDAPRHIVAFRDARWNTRWLVLGLVVLALWRGFGFVDLGWLLQFPTWLILVVTGVAPQVFLLVYPLLTCNPNQRATFGMPPLKRCLIELGIAVLVLIGHVLAFTAAYRLVEYVSPGAPLVPDAIANLARSSNRTLVYALLVFSFTAVPIAEEVFFRGFLYNAFRARMPTLVAALTQSLIFGFSHFFGVTHAVYACLVGLFQTAVYQWRKTLVTPILVHARANFVSAIGTVLMMFAHANSPMIGVFGDPNDSACVIQQIVPNSPAEKAGLQVDDIITSVDAEPIRDYPHLRQIISLYKVGDAIPVTVMRSGSEFEITVVLQQRGE